MCRKLLNCVAVLVAVLALLAEQALSAELKVVALHPLMADLARNVGGDRVEVVSLLKPGDGVHEFAPKPAQMSEAARANLVLASGKHLETYLDKLRDSLPAGVEIIEVGRTIPSMKISGDDELFVCCPAHSVGGIDPHWWHSVSNMRRAVRVVEKAFTNADPQGKDYYSQKAGEYTRRLEALDGWVRARVAEIPREQRKLVTAHLAFGYFCREYGFKALPIQGLTRERQPTAQYLTESIKTLQREKIRAVFPEHDANPKVISQLVAETGVNLGGKLVADGSASGDLGTYEGMMRHNVQTIVDGLK